MDGACAPARDLCSRQAAHAHFLGWKQTCVKRVLFGRRGVLWQRIEGGQPTCTRRLAGSPAWFLVRRWHGIERVAAKNLAATLLAPPQPQALTRKVQGIYERFSKACGVFGFAAALEKVFTTWGEHAGCCSPSFAAAERRLSGG